MERAFALWLRTSERLVPRRARLDKRLRTYPDLAVLALEHFDHVRLVDPRYNPAERGGAECGSCAGLAGGGWGKIGAGAPYEGVADLQHGALSVLLEHFIGLSMEILRCAWARGRFANGLDCSQHLSERFIDQGGQLARPRVQLRPRDVSNALARLRL